MARFATGQTVMVSLTKGGNTPAGRYKIVAALPAMHGVTRYRVKGEGESWERVVDEDLLIPQVL